jgi:7-carboxy-7-deazaguanine synthase
MLDTLRISEIFYSLQGESSRVGLPTVFIRLTGCPLRCVYCDTSYAFSGGVKMSFDAIFKEVEKYQCGNVCVTGGEPLAQSECISLLAKLVDLGYCVSLETSGALDVSKVDSRVTKVMDLKTPSSGEMDKNRYENIAYLSAHDEVKFVIAGEEDYNWSKNILKQYDLTNHCYILFSPVADQQNPTQLAEKILEDKLAVRFQIQLHKLLWQDAQGK